MAKDYGQQPNLTYKVDLPGGQRRLREAILYVCEKFADAERFGLVKLNKVLWYADFRSFAERGQPITGRHYQRLRNGPAPVEMLPLLQEMKAADEIKIQITQYDEQRPVALVPPLLRDFSPSDLAYLDRAIEVFWDSTAKGASDRSHGVAWKTREDGDPMPYELAYLSDQPIGAGTRAKLLKLGQEFGWRSK